MIIYGSYAQAYFNYDEENPAHGGIVGEEAYKAVENVTKDQLAIFSHDTSDSISGVTYVGSRLVLEEYTSFQPYFRISDAALNKVQFSCNGNILEPIWDESYRFYYISLDGIAARDLDAPQLVTITNTVDGTTAEMTFVPLTYAKDVCAKMNNKQELVNLVKALYLYNQQTNAFFENQSAN